MKKKIFPKRTRKNRGGYYDRIPTGMYCYTFTGETGVDEKGRSWYGTTLCPFYSHKNKMGYCKLIKGTDPCLDEC